MENKTGTARKKHAKKSLQGTLKKKITQWNDDQMG